jgi:RHS repeat-associated protein
MRWMFCWIQVVFTGIAIAVTSNSAAQSDPALIKVLDGASGNFKVDSFVTVSDGKWWDPTEHAKIDTTLPYTNRNIIKLKINEESVKWIASNFTTSVDVRIIYTNKGGLTDSTDYTFKVNYDSTKGIAYDNNSIFSFNNAFNVTTKILSITTTYPSGITAWNVIPLLRLENEMQIQRYYNFDCSAVSYPFYYSTLYVASHGVLQFIWAPVAGATEYDVEWTFIDSVALSEGIYGSPSSPDIASIFAAGATRVTVYGEVTNIGLLYEKSGYLFCRVRAVQSRPNDQRVEAKWVNEVHSNPAFYIYYFAGHEPDLNWQVTTSFAEESKSKTVIQYFDGSLRNRQTVTMDNSLGQTLAAETFYDYQGRPTIQVLPAPTLSTIIKYIDDFNTALGGGEYEKSVYDSLLNPGDYCSAPAPPMSSSYGANWYYSANNGYANLYNSHKAIPIAYGYAFTETRYSQDNTGRVMAQGGVGPQYQPGSKHETKYFYGKPDQQELDALFGTEAGIASHYQKNMVRDANGQYSVSYVDMHGRTIATALAGKPDSVNVDTLESYNVSTITKKLIDPETIVINGPTMQSTTGLVVTKAGINSFHYSLSPDSLQLATCDSTDICYDCVYNLEISISDECNNQLLPSNQRYVLIDSNFTLAALDTVCGNGVVGFDTTFTLYLTEGSYTISKKLSVSRPGYEYYRDSVFLKKNLCKTFQDFYEEELELLQDCEEVSCGTCLTQLGTYESFKINYAEQTGIPSGQITQFEDQIQQAYNTAKDNCAQLCDSLAEHDAIWELMLADMSPESGQYANPELPFIGFPYNIFYSPTIGSPYKFQTVTGYKDENGKLDSIYNSIGILVSPNDISITPSIFIAQFKPSWAKTLISLHPEYIRFLVYQSMSASNIWDERFRKTDTYAEAKAKGYLNPINEPDYPFLPMESGGQDPTSIYPVYIYDRLKAKVLDYIPDEDYSMWGLATATAHCNDGDEDCFEEFLDTDNAFDSTRLCRGELDMAWRSFRQMYLSEKRMITGDYLRLFGSMSDLIVEPYVQRFPNWQEMFVPIGPVSTNPTTLLNALADSMNNYYASNCESYSRHWWLQLAGCNFNATDSAIIMPRLIKVCREGSDMSHPYGSSTVNPSSAYTFRSFDEVIKHFLDSAGRSYDTACNGYLINMPRPYERPPAYASIPIWGTPDSCQCDRITNKYEEYLSSSGIDTSFSAYMNRTSNATISESELQQLLQMCNNEYGCKFLEEPIKLPPALQCAYTGPCLGCDSITVWHGRFVDRFSVTPSYDDNDSLQSLHNRLYGNYMNFFSGFNKTYVEYLQFKDSCDYYDSSSLECDTLKQILADFRQDYYYGHTPGFDPNGCDTTMWAFVAATAYESGLVTYRDMFDNGIVHAPDSLYDHVTTGDYLDSIGIKQFNFALRPDVCNISNELTWEFRARYNTFWGYNHHGGLILHFQLYRMDLSIIDISIYLLRQGSPIIYVNGVPYSSGPAIDMQDWRRVSVKIENNSIRLFDNGVFVNEAPYTGTAVRAGNFSISPNFTDMSIDYWRFFAGDGRPILNENFTYACDSFAVMNPAFDCTKLPCDSAFTDYFNQHQGTSYSIAELQQLFVETCGREAKPCQPSDDTLLICSDGEWFPEMEIPDEGPCSDTASLAFVLATEKYNAYKDSLLAAFDSLYLGKCMEAYKYEDFTVTAPQSEFHYTLYYYDQAGNLVRTVPPAGVDITKFGWSSNWTDSVATARNNSQLLVPAHLLATNYRYNSLNQAVAQHSPDGGSSSFWYDRLGRPALSQNAKQVNGSWYSYTRYDSLGRITEVGELANTNGATDVVSDAGVRDPEWMEDLVTLNSRRQITNTYYDHPYIGFAGLPEPLSARNLRTRVSFSTYTEGGNPALYDQASFYSYDIHGNVDTLLQDYRTGAMNINDHRFKKIVYRYDLISGKVNQVAYQRGEADQFYHNYSHDGENRLTHVYTSTDSIIWERDGLYSYLIHGPLARTVLGQQKVQGQDYAYTLQGWLKAINGTGTLMEIGNDGADVPFPNHFVARDAYGVVLYYNSQDYDPALATGYSIIPDVPQSLGSGFRSLYNGNIAAMSYNHWQLNYPVSNPSTHMGTMLYAYKYDQLNRITGMDAYTKAFPAGHTWNNLDALNDYKERVSYDANGNILKYLRHGTTLNSKPLSMDSLSYKYYEGNNRLRQVRDSVNGTNYTEDIDDQGDTTNYVYDPIGNLIQDKAEGIDSMRWNVYGKISNIYKSSGLNISYTYDAGGNRISKKVMSEGDTTITWYVRDATGNVMSTYLLKEDTTKQDEIHLYGSSRLGILRPERFLNLDEQYGDTSGTLSLLGTWRGNVFRRGQKLFELTNHLGNVLTTISDKKSGLDTNSDSTVDYYGPDVMTANDYYPFGMGMPERNYASTTIYRYGFNGYENDNEIKGQGNSLDFGSRVYDPRLGKWLSLDPLQSKYPNESNYSYVSGNPIIYKDVDGKDKIITITVIGKDGRGFQIRIIDEKYFKYTFSKVGFYFRKSSVTQHLIIDLRESPSVTGVMNPERIFQYSENDDLDIEYIGWFEWSIFGTGDNSGETGYGHRIYGNGTDEEWQDGLPTSADGEEGIDLGDWLGLASAISPNDAGAFESISSYIKKLGGLKGDDMKKVGEAVEIIVTKTEQVTDILVSMLELQKQIKELTQNANGDSPRLDPGGNHKPDEIDPNTIVYPYTPNRKGVVDAWSSDSNQTKPLWEKRGQKNQKDKEPPPKKIQNGQ